MKSFLIFQVRCVRARVKRGAGRLHRYVGVIRLKAGPRRMHPHRRCSYSKCALNGLAVCNSLVRADFRATSQ